MKAFTVIELSVDEAKDRLIDFYADVVVNDRANTRDLIRDGKLGSAIPNFPSIDDDRVAELFGDFDLGRQIAEEQGASHVVVRTDDYKWDIVFDIDNVPPKNRWGEWRLLIQDEDKAHEDTAPLVGNAQEVTTHAKAA